MFQPHLFFQTLKEQFNGALQQMEKEFQGKIEKLEHSQNKERKELVSRTKKDQVRER